MKNLNFFLVFCEKYVKITKIANLKRSFIINYGTVTRSEGLRLDFGTINTGISDMRNSVKINNF